MKNETIVVPKSVTRPQIKTFLHQVPPGALIELDGIIITIIAHSADFLDLDAFGQSDKELFAAMQTMLAQGKAAKAEGAARALVEQDVYPGKAEYESKIQMLARKFRALKKKNETLF